MVFAPDSPHPVAAAARFRAMVDTHFASIWRFLRGIGVPSASVDDAAQHVFVIASERLADIEPGKESGFLFSTARGVAANLRRGEARRQALQKESLVSARPATTPNPEQLMEAAEARRLLDLCLEAIDEEPRAVFILYELEGETMATIAELLGVPPGTIASRLRRAREQFQAATKRLLAQRGGR